MSTDDFVQIIKLGESGVEGKVYPTKEVHTIDLCCLVSALQLSLSSDTVYVEVCGKA